MGQDETGDGGFLVKADRGGDVSVFVKLVEEGGVEIPVREEIVGDGENAFADGDDGLFLFKQGCGC